MILKVKRQTLNREWWILDNIKILSIFDTEKMTRVALDEKLDEVRPDKIMMDILWNSEANGKTCSDTDLFSMKLLDVTTDTMQFTIAFDTFAYLCNDEGKTIDRIIV